MRPQFNQYKHLVIIIIFVIFSGCVSERHEKEDKTLENEYFGAKKSMRTGDYGNAMHNICHPLIPFISKPCRLRKGQRFMVGQPR